MRTFAIAVLLVVFVLPAAADFEVYEVSAPIRTYDPTWPPDTSPWHGIHPGPIYCTISEQTDHDDSNGNGQIDACESIELDGIWRHIEWIGPTFTLAPIPPDPGRPIVTLRVEPFMGPGRPPAPTEYHVVYPSESFCMVIVTNVPLEQECQIVYIESPPEYVGEWHVESIDTNIHVGTGSPVEPTTWGAIKEFFSKLF
jgi:hypothetical protein